MRERAINIGQPISLAGVMTEPEQAAAGKPVFIILNSGVMHHVGACRLSVKLARELASQAGITSIRFDFSSIGDSANRKQQASLEQAAGDEIREVIDHVEQKLGVDRVILCGLCSGAHNGFHAAIADRRVVGLVQFDGHCYPTAQSYLRFYAPRLFKWKHWRSVMRRAFGRLANAGQASPQAGPESVDPRYVEQPLFAEKPPKAVMEDGLQQLVERKVRLLLVFTGTDHLDFMYPQQYADCFSTIDFAGLLRVEHFPHATHIVTEPHYQEQLLEHTRSWIMDYS